MRDEVTQLMESIKDVFRSLHTSTYHKSEKHHLYPGQPKLLVLIKNNEGIRQKDLSCRNGVKPATITGMLNKLEAKHYVYRVPDETDKRSMRVYLTPEGRRLADYSERFMEDLIEQLFVGFSDEELKTLKLLTDKMRDNLNRTPK